MRELPGVIGGALAAGLPRFEANGDQHSDRGKRYIERNAVGEVSAALPEITQRHAPGIARCAIHFGGAVLSCRAA